MKKFFIVMSAVAAALLIAGCSSGNTYTLKGTLAGVPGPVYILNEEGTVIDSATVSNGSFSFKRDYEGPGFYTLRDNAGGIPSFVAPFFVEPGTLHVQDDSLSRNKSVIGTPANDAFVAMSLESAGLMAESRNKNTTEARQEEIEQEYDDMMASYFEKNHDNYFGVYLLNQQSYYYTGQELLDEVNAFPEELQATRILTKLRATAEQRIKTDVGSQYLEVSQNDPDGKEILLSSVVENPANKYVLLDFWASWCGPCMAEVPYLVQTYKEYHKKGFEIYGVSFDTKAENWTKAIKEKELSWVHVSDLKRFDNQAARDYAIQAIPSNVLINCADGAVVAKNLRGEDVYNTISGLLGQ